MLTFSFCALIGVYRLFTVTNSNTVQNFLMEEYDGYSDDFEEEVESVEVSEPRLQAPTEVSLAKPLERIQSHSPDLTPPEIKAVNTKRNTSYTRWKRKGRRLFSTPKALPPPAPAKSNTFSPRDREMSACKHAMRRLESKFSEEHKLLDEVRKENKLLNRLHIRQEKELNRFQSQEGELPQLLTRHAEEVRVLREHLKRSMNNSQSNQKQSNEYRQEVLRLKDQMKRFGSIANKKDLIGRDKLTQQLQVVTSVVKDKEEKIVELERRLELENKNHVSEVRALIQRNRFLSTEVEDVRQASQRVQSKLKEKEKNLDIMNMYTQRFGKVTQRLSIVPTPVVFSQSTQTQITCPISPSSSSSSVPAKTCETKCTQTTLKLNPKESNLELKVLHVSHRVIDPLRAAHKAVQTSMEESPSRSLKNASIQTSESMPTPSTGSGMPADVTPAHKLLPNSNAGTSNDDSTEEERRKKEELLAKLRAIDGIKNPPESLPIESAAARGFNEQSSQSGAEKSGGSKQAGVEKRLDGQIGLIETDKPAVTSSQQKANYDSLWSTGQSTGGQTPSNNLLQKSPLFPERSGPHQSQSSGPGQGSSSNPPQLSQFQSSGQGSSSNPPHQNHFSQSQSSGLDQGSSSNPPHRNQFSGPGQGSSSNWNQFSQSQSSGPGQGSNNHQNPFSLPATSQLTTMQSNGNQTGIDSQPFQTLNASRVTGYRSVNSPGRVAQATGTTQPLGPNSVSTKLQETSKQSSLFNLTGGLMTKASTDFSTLREGRRGTSPIRSNSNLSSSQLQDEERRATLPLDFTKKLDIIARPDSRQKKESTLKPSSSRTSSISSLQSWPDTVHNLHIGKPAYSTDSDPFGSKHVAVLAKSVRSSTQYKPVHGRRAGTLEEVPDNLGSISENHPGSTVHQKHNIKPRSDSQSYPWEVGIDVQEQEAKLAGKAQRRSSDRTNSGNTTASLLPLRPKQGSIGTISARNSVVEPDDLEQVIL